MEYIEYNRLPGRFAASNEDFLSRCARLYSEHYGIWGENGIRPGKAIKLSNNKLREWLENDDAIIYYASMKDDIIGYAIAVNKKENGYGIVTWVTQLVVHKDYRNKGVAKSILFSIWGFSDHYAWGIVSANPYAIRALEKATRRRATPIRIKKNYKKLMNVGRESVPFIGKNTQIEVTIDTSKINTEFYVDHSDTLNKIANVASEDIPWTLGTIEEGWEWFAFTFNDQEQISLSKEEIEIMVKTSDSVVKNAYSRMNLDEKKQKWMGNTVNEIEYINEKIDLTSIQLAYDLGCGIGRHAIELAKRNIYTIGIDYVDRNVELAMENIERSGVEKIQIVGGDCRNYRNSKKASLVICLYDVIGTFAEKDDNQNIIRTAYELLDETGYAVFSVMNYESTLANAQNTFALSKDANRLLDLLPSNTMERTGNVFDPSYYLVDTETQLTYRKEQFTCGGGLPVELIVRDRRFTKDEIVAMCEKEGFSIIEAKYTNASGWEKEYDGTDSRAKEILVICKKEL